MSVHSGFAQIGRGVAEQTNLSCQLSMGSWLLLGMSRELPTDSLMSCRPLLLLLLLLLPVALLLLSACVGAC
jgi:hypothetical protein